MEPEIVEDRRGDDVEAKRGMSLSSYQPQVPLAGSSISLSREKAPIPTGLGGYVLVDGKKYGLTNHHVLFGQAEPLAAGSNYKVVQPALLDVEQSIEYLEEDLREAEVWTNAENASTINQQIVNFEGLLSPNNSTIGKVSMSSGIQALDSVPDGRRYSMDWALIDMETDRMANKEDIVDKVCDKP